jgi:hypothetical protein
MTGPQNKRMKLKLTKLRRHGCRDGYAASCPRRPDWRGHRFAAYPPCSTDGEAQSVSEEDSRRFMDSTAQSALAWGVVFILSAGVSVAAGSSRLGRSGDSSPRLPSRRGTSQLLPARCGCLSRGELDGARLSGHDATTAESERADAHIAHWPCRQHFINDDERAAAKQSNAAGIRGSIWPSLRWSA